MDKEPLKIVFDGRTIKQGKAGIGTYSHNLLSNLVKINESSSIKAFFLEDFKHKSLNFVIEKTSVSYENHPLGDLWELFFLPFYLYYEKTDIFHSPTFHLPLLTFGTKKIVTIHDLAVFKHPQTFPTTFSIYNKILTRLASKFSDAVIVPSISTKKDVLEILGVDEKKIFVVPEAASDNFRVIKDSKILDQVRSKHNLPENYILFVGTIEPRKNLLSLIQSYSFLKKKGAINHKLVVSGGKGWLKESERINKLIIDMDISNEVIFTGYVPENDLVAIYNMADLFVYPSLYEGFGIPLLEAMSCGCPVIASNRSAVPEVVGDAAILVNPLNDKELSEAIIKVLNEKRVNLDLKAAGFNRVKQFSWERAAMEMMKIYKNVSRGTKSCK